MHCNTGNTSNLCTQNDLRFGIDRMPVAMAYVPWQRFGRTLDLDQALRTGTIFPELTKPFCGGNCG